MVKEEKNISLKKDLTGRLEEGLFALPTHNMVINFTFACSICPMIRSTVSPIQVYANHYMMVYSHFNMEIRKLGA